MKYPLVFALNLFAALHAHAQTDTTFYNVEQVTEDEPKPTFSDTYEYFYGSKLPVDNVFKVHFVRSDEPIYQTLNLGFEKKLFPSFSLQGNYGLGIVNETDYRRVAGVVTIGNDTSVFYSSNVGLVQRASVDMRFYVNMKKRMNRGLSANNINGNYFALSGIFNNSVSNLSGARDRDFKSTAVEFRYGMQRRLLRYVFLDLSFGLGATKLYREGDDGKFKANKLKIYSIPRLTLGLAIASPNEKPEEKAAYCEVFRCFREENSMFKIDLARPFLSSFSSNGYSTGLDVAFEQRIGGNHLTWEGALAASSSKENGSNPISRIDRIRWSAGADASLKYYYSKKKRIAMGKEGKNLSGYYFGAFMGLRHDFSDDQSQYDRTKFEPVRYDRDYVQTGIFWGLQKRLFKNGFIELRFKVMQNEGLEKGQRNQNDYEERFKDPDFNILGRVGFAF